MNENNYENNKNINSDSEEVTLNNDNKNDKDIQGSEEKGEKIPSQEAQADAFQGEGAEEEIKEASGEGQNDREEELSTEKDDKDENISGESKYSTDYTPPHYIPNFTVVNNTDAASSSDAKKKKAKKKQYGAGALVAICAICVALSVTLGAIAGAIAGGGIILDLSGNGDDELVKIIRSNREITVEEVLGETGYSDMTVAQVAAYIGGNVVEITTTHVETNTFYGQYITSGAGSGVVFDQNDKGYTYIVTNYHVIDGADEISVRIKDGDSYSDYVAEYIAGDSAEDIAVIGIKYVEHTFEDLVFAQSDKLLVGEQVVAIGNPLGQLGGTVTDGIISALDREIIIGDNTMTLLQTNAAINPGNSGGGLFNMAGELVGIVNAKQSSTGIEGLGFAIPSDVVYKDIQDILEYGYVRGRITFGVTVQYGSIKEGKKEVYGVYVTNAGKSNFEYLDRIIKINDTSIETMSDYNAVLKKLSVGEQVTVCVARDGSFVDINVKAQENTSKY